MTATLSHVSTTLPEHTLRPQDLPEIASEWLGEDTQTQEKFLRIGRNSGVETRRFIAPYREILKQSGLQSRSEMFEHFGIEMLTSAIEATLEHEEISPEEIGALVFTSCSVPVIPSIDAAAILKSRLLPSTSRIPIYQHGCAGGVIGMALGAKLAQLGKPVLVSSVELCSLVFQPKNQCGAHLVGASIFADGAAATLIRPEGSGVQFLGSQSYLIPESRHLMGYDIFDDGFHLRLDRSLPQKLILQAPTVVQDFLKNQNTSTDKIDYWLFHPGGIKILEFLRETFQLSKDQCHWSYDVLRDHGNLSSATILYVMNAFLQENVLKPGERALVMGIGPGLTIELILLEG
jgi:alkylresorcinol/alkylpyrone synthase